MLRNSIKLFQITNRRTIFKQSTIVRHYAVDHAEHAAPSSYLNKEDVNERIINVLKKHDKVDASKVTDNSHLVQDLGLDSLDTAEIISEIEQEFVIEIANEEAFKLQSVPELVKYISSSPVAK